MHLLATTSTTLDEIVEPVDLGQPPGDMVVLSFADSDLAGLAAAWAVERDALPSVRLAHLRDLRHPMSVDLWIDRVGAHAKVILVRLLGGLDWWRYGVERLSALARERGIALALLPGEDRDDPRLAAGLDPCRRTSSTRCCGFFREGGRENLRALLRRLARHAGARAGGARAAAGAAHGRLSAGHRRGRSRPARRRARARPAGRADHLLSRAAARRRHRADRRAVRGAGGARPCAGAARRHQPQGRGRGGVRPRRRWRGSRPPSSSPPRPSPPAASRASRRRSTGRTCRCCRS